MNKKTLRIGIVATNPFLYPVAAGMIVAGVLYGVFRTVGKPFKNLVEDI